MPTRRRTGLRRIRITRRRTGRRTSRLYHLYISYILKHHRIMKLTEILRCIKYEPNPVSIRIILRQSIEIPRIIDISIHTNLRITQISILTDISIFNRLRSILRDLLDLHKTTGNLIRGIGVILSIHYMIDTANLHVYISTCMLNISI